MASVNEDPSSITAPRGIFYNLRQKDAETHLHDMLTKSSQSQQAPVIGFMCACTGWRNCHRQVIATWISQRGRNVWHALPGGALEPHPSWIKYDNRFISSQGGTWADAGWINTSSLENSKSNKNSKKRPSRFMKKVLSVSNLSSRQY